MFFDLSCEVLAVNSNGFVVIWNTQTHTVVLL